MKNLFAATYVDEVQRRLALLQPDSPRQWGKMTAAQAMHHCSRGFETALGARPLPRIFLGRVLGGWIKKMVFADDQPLRKNTSTDKTLIVHQDCDLAKEREQLAQWIEKFSAAGPAGCTTHPHFFFGYLTADEWAILMYKHMDHHLRQFGA